MNTLRNSCSAFCWNEEGHCYGVRLDIAAGRYKVAAVWHATCEGSSGAYAEKLAEGRKALGMNEASYCLASPGSGGWGMSEIEVPWLKGREMEAALAFELKKCTPIPVEQLTWGYRILKSMPKDRRLRIRLFYVKKEVWRKWMSIASGLSQVDLVMPAPVALDPLFAGQSVLFPGKSCFLYASDADGRDAVPGSVCDASGALRPFNELLPMDELDWGEAETLSAEEKIALIPALVLAIYGMTRNAGSDVKTMPKVPIELKPKRYQGYQIASAVLATVAVVLFLFGLMQGAQLRRGRIRLIKKDISAVQAELRALQQTTNGNVTTLARQLEDEMARYRIEAPSLPEVLYELTSLSKTPAWCAGSFTWTMDASDSVVPVTFMLREPVGDTANLDICAMLNNSPVLGDVVENKSATSRTGFAERRFSLKARYDTEEEASALEAYKQKQREEETKKKLAAAMQKSLDNAVQKKLDEVVNSTVESDNEEDTEPAPAPAQVPKAVENKSAAPVENPQDMEDALLMSEPANAQQTEE